MTRADGKLLVEQKIEDFYKNEKELLSKVFQETEARNRFIDPLFQALGWDFHQTNLKKDFWDVHREFSQKDNSSTKKPDYAFRIKDGKEYKEKFFVEAKAPWVKLTDSDPVHQAKRYSFSSHGKTPIVILTDFQEFRVFNGTERPVFENPLQGLIKELDLRYTDYLDKWDLIFDTFSKEAVYNGSIDKLVGKVAKNTKNLDYEFLKDITEWRELLARNIALRNKDLTVNELNEAVQRIIDRFIFIRNLEDREIEPENTLLNIARDQGATIEQGGALPCSQRLSKLYLKLNDSYNGLLFKPHFSEKLTVDDKVIKDIIKNMCYPVSPFQFDIIEPEILGRIYERFLGSKIRLTENHQAKVEEKPEVRKAGGVYYTPQYIVDYIVENTVGSLLNKGFQPLAVPMTPEEIEKIKILDPACGSGSFLIGAFQYLINYHKNWFATAPKNIQRNYKDDFYITADGEVKLTLSKKSEILKNNIFGVDIDREATEVAIMSLYLKLLDEGYDKGQAELFMKGHILPDMTGNVKCGNSLIGTNYFDNVDLSLFGNDELKEINAFDWKDEFSGIFTDKNVCKTGNICETGGFDCVIGNPPYIRIQTLNEYSSNSVAYFNKEYSNIVSDSYDIYVLFIYKGFELLKKDGLLGYILPHKFFQAQMGTKIRKYIFDKQSIDKIVDFTTNQIFDNATTYTCLLFLSNQERQHFNYKKFELNQDFKNLNNLDFDKKNNEILDSEMWNFSSNNVSKILESIYKQPDKFSEITNKIFKGSSTGNDTIYLLEKVEVRDNTYILFSKELNKNVEIEKSIMRPFIYGEDVKRYEYLSNKVCLLFPYSKKETSYKLIDISDMKKDYPLCLNYLKEVKSVLQQRKIPLTNDDFYKYSAARSLNDYEQTKILIPDMLVKNRMSYDYEGVFFHGPAIHSVVFKNDYKNINELFYLGILNSNLFWFFISNTSTALRGNAYRLTPEFLNNFCFPNVDLSNKDKKENHDSLTALVDNIIQTQKDFRNAKSDSDKSMFEKKINMIDKKIDELVYRLYGLTEDEIKIIEGE